MNDEQRADSRHFILYARFSAVLHTIYVMRRLAMTDGDLPPDTVIPTDEEIAATAYGNTDRFLTYYESRQRERYLELARATDHIPG